MREIKFRVWNPLARVLTGGLDIMTMLMTTDKEFVAEVQEKGYILEQYTGLKDNKRTPEYPEGQEIYEGDIVSLNSRGRYRVRYDAYSWSFQMGLSPHVLDQECSYRSENLEVIGNIHES